MGGAVVADAMGTEVAAAVDHTLHVSSCIPPLLAMESMMDCIDAFIIVGLGGGS